MPIEVKIIKDNDMGKIGQIINMSNGSAKSMVEQGYAEYIEEDIPKKKPVKNKIVEVKLLKNFNDGRKKGAIEKWSLKDALLWEKEGIIKILDEVEEKPKSNKHWLVLRDLKKHKKGYEFKYVEGSEQKYSEYVKKGNLKLVEEAQEKSLSLTSKESVPIETEAKRKKENKPEFNLFIGHITKLIPTRNICIEDFPGLIKTDTALLKKVRNEKDKDKQRELKVNLGYVTFGGTFTTRAGKNLIKSSGYACLDYDGFTNEDLNITVEKLKKDKYTHLFFISPSGKGIKLIVKIPEVKDNEEYKSYWSAIAKYHNLKQTDEQAKDIARACFLSYDETPFYNPDSEVFIEKVEVNSTLSIPENKIRKPILLKQKSAEANVSEEPNIKKNCAFMDYCLTHEIPRGERHNKITRNMALYISDHPDRELLRTQYFKIQKGSEQSMERWLKSIDENGKDKYPFSCGEMINFQKKYGIPLKCKGCPKFDEFKKEKKAEKKLQKAVEIEDRKDYTELQKAVFQEILLKDFGKASELLVREIEDNNFIYSTRDDLKSEMWIYRDGVYVPNGKFILGEFCRKILGDVHSQFIVNLVINKVEKDTAIDPEDFFENKYVDLLPVQNGILNVITREVSPFDPEKIFFNKLPVEYDEEATCPNIEKFMKDILKEDEDDKVMYELIGRGLMKDYFTEKAAMFVGFGRNGKTSAINLIKKLIGIENCSSVPIRAMKEDNSSLCELHGKLFNLAGDLSQGDLKETGVFKQTCGRDQLQTHRKFLRDLKFVNFAQHIFACNELQRVFETKLYVMKFQYQKNYLVYLIYL